MPKTKTLTFDEKEHKYYWGGVLVPSVTQILQVLYDLSHIPKHILEAAAARGGATHKMVQLYLQGILNESKLSEDLKECLHQFQLFMENPNDGGRFDISSAVLEYPMVSGGKFRYAGTPDIIVDGQVIIDIKRRVFNEWFQNYVNPLQLEAYETLWVDNGGSRDGHEHWNLYLYPDRYLFIKARNGQSRQMFRKLLKHWYAQQEMEALVIAWQKQQ